MSEGKDVSSDRVPWDDFVGGYKVSVRENVQKQS